MRAPVLDRERSALVPHDHDRQRADLAEKPSVLLEFGERPEAGRRGERVGHGFTLRLPREYVNIWLVKLQSPVSVARRRHVDRLKRSGPTTSAALAHELGLTEAAVRQHLAGLEEAQLVERS
ncbi:MAG: ArsR family transcriptional regulator, partial [Actinobacteria bacterium]